MRNPGLGSLNIEGNSATFYTGLETSGEFKSYPKYTIADYKTTMEWPSGIQHIDVIENSLYDSTHKQSGMFSVK